MKKINNFVFTILIFFMPSIIHGMEQTIEYIDFNTFEDFTDPQEQIFLDLLATSNQTLPTTYEQFTNVNNIPNNTLKRQQEEDNIQNQQNKKQKLNPIVISNQQLPIANIILNDSSKQHLCIQCNTTFSSAGNLKKHLITIHTNENRFKCSYCDESFNRKDVLNTHETKKHIKPFKCIDCNIGFGSLSLLKKHETNNHNTFTCPYSGCDQIFINRGSLDTHIKKYHISVETPITIFKKKNILNKDEIKKHIKPFICKNCNRNFSTLFLLNKHITNHHNTFICTYPDCNAVFNLKDSWKTHVKRHEKNYNCSHCKKNFSTKTELTIHERVHTGNKIPCTYNGCTKTFVSKGNLHLHIQRFHIKKIIN